MIFSKLALAGLFAASVSAHITGISVEPSTKGRSPRSLSGSKKSYFRLTFTTESDDNTIDYSVVIGLANSTTSSPSKRTDASSNIGQAIDVIDLLAIGKSETTGKNFTISVPFPHNVKRSKKGKNSPKKGKSGTKKGKSGTKKGKSGDSGDSDNEDDDENDDENESFSQLYTVTAAVTYSASDETKLQFFTTPLNVTSS
ncbi:hypothetical protein EXIGLDRAFT_834048 [Exidia glandulosa HHB12029]|uniref:Uncharacterized protein n=1 Tax=Exidia glandulosa HHB12029 TaxID=1314781 RepID=A0A165K6X3_EXIGL|nr:hypothetical protein EXIGLDRAFT_834048 [Exidia glandulosa HHB12029]